MLICGIKLSVNSSHCVPSCPRYLSDLLHCVSDLTSRCHLRSLTSSELVIPLSWLVTVGDRSFAVAGPRLLNTLPEDITSAPSLLVFRRKLKMHLFWNLIRTFVWLDVPGGP